MRHHILAYFAGTALSFAEPMKPEFHYTTFIAKPAKDVWSALTEKKTIDQYHMAPLHTQEMKKGGRISYGGGTELISVQYEYGHVRCATIVVKFHGDTLGTSESGFNSHQDTEAGSSDGFRHSHENPPPHGVTAGFLQQQPEMGIRLG